MGSAHEGAIRSTDYYFEAESIRKSTSPHRNQNVSYFLSTMQNPK